MNTLNTHRNMIEFLNANVFQGNIHDDLLCCISLTKNTYSYRFSTVKKIVYRPIYVYIYYIMHSKDRGKQKHIES